MENAATTNQEQRIPRVGAIHKPRKFKIAKMWGLFIKPRKIKFREIQNREIREVAVLISRVNLQLFLPTLSEIQFQLLIH